MHKDGGKRIATIIKALVESGPSLRTGYFIRQTETLE
ncbi:MAG: hypothetical protein K0R78_2503 [Pelosinus sp.]|jgi:hypothetical protein|nr:hypothetical protein [Pelosinus sp.]